MAVAAGFSSSGSVSEYMKQLLEKAEEYCNGSFDNVTHFFRNKPESYFNSIKMTDNVMRKAQKDGGGDPRSPINNSLSGVFFSVTLRHGSFPPKSPFGNTRVHVPIKAVFDDSTNLYFTDFYCFKKTIHYIILVLSKKGSAADLFCQANLPKLDPENNMFLRKTGGLYPQYRTTSQGMLHLEIFYTEDVDINALTQLYGSDKVFFSKTATHGKGTSTFGGIRKNGRCCKCNIGVSLASVLFDSDSEEDMFDDYSTPWYGVDYDSDPDYY